MGSEQGSPTGGVDGGWEVWFGCRKPEKGIRLRGVWWSPLSSDPWHVAEEKPIEARAFDVRIQLESMNEASSREENSGRIDMKGIDRLRDPRSVKLRRRV